MSVPESITDQNTIRGDKDLLLHVCCGPCAEWPVESLREEGYSLTAFFSNPNIHPRFEHDRRRGNAASLMKMRGVPFLEDDSYMEDRWLAKAWEGQYSSRCEMCYDIRMKRAALEAQSLGFRSFSTTLLVSPYQNHEAIITYARKAAAETGVDFVYRDFRPGFREGQNMAKEDGLYRQKYCGCIFSLEESAFRDKIYKSFAGSEGETRTVL